MKTLELEVRLIVSVTIVGNVSLFRFFGRNFTFVVSVYQWSFVVPICQYVSGILSCQYVSMSVVFCRGNMSVCQWCFTMLPGVGA